MERIKVEWIRTVKLMLETRFYLELAYTVYAPSVRFNLISLSKHDKLGYTWSFGNGLFQLMFQSRIIGNGVMNGNLYRLNLNESVYFQTEFDNNLSYVL